MIIWLYWASMLDAAMAGIIKNLNCRTIQVKIKKYVSKIFLLHTERGVVTQIG